MAESSTGNNLLAELETRQDEVLQQLEALDQRVERTLAECVGTPRPEAPAANH